MIRGICEASSSRWNCVKHCPGRRHHDSVSWLWGRSGCRAAAVRGARVVPSSYATRGRMHFPLWPAPNCVQLEDALQLDVISGAADVKATQQLRSSVQKGRWIIVKWFFIWVIAVLFGCCDELHIFMFLPLPCTFHRCYPTVNTQMHSCRNKQETRPLKPPKSMHNSEAPGFPRLRFNICFVAADTWACPWFQSFIINK